MKHVRQITKTQSPARALDVVDGIDYLFELISEIIRIVGEFANLQNTKNGVTQDGED